MEISLSSWGVLFACTGGLLFEAGQEEMQEAERRDQSSPSARMPVRQGGITVGRTPHMG